MNNSSWPPQGNGDEDTNPERPSAMWTHGSYRRSLRKLEDRIDAIEAVLVILGVIIACLIGATAHLWLVIGRS